MKHLRFFLVLIINVGFAMGGISDPELPFTRVAAPAQPRPINCWYSNNIADCAWANWTTIPLPNVNYNVTSLLLNNNRIPKIQANSLTTWPVTLLNIDLSGNRIASVDSYAFTRFKSLQYLDLSSNLLSSVDAKLLNSATNLRGLSFRKNGLLAFPELSDPIQLKILFLDQNRLTRIGNLQSKLPGLQTLTLNSNNLTAFGPLPSTLLYLDIRQNNFTSLTKLTSLVLLKTLRLGHPTFVSSGQDLIGLANLSTLELDGIQGSYPKQYFTTTITQLFLRNNAVKIVISLPNNITELEISSLTAITTISTIPLAIKRLTITDCPFLYISFVPLLNSLTNLTYLHLRNININDRLQARLEFLQGKLTDLILENCSYTAMEAPELLFSNTGNSITTLNMRHNSITKIETARVQYLTQLTNLTVSYNKLTSFGFSTFRINSRLIYIDLSYNLIDVIYNADLPINRPTSLNLAGNRIIKIDASFLRGLQALRVFDLSYNLLTEFSTFANLSHDALKVVSIGNPWACDCENVTAFTKVTSLVSFVCEQTSSVTSVPCVICHTPVSEKGKYISSVSCGSAGNGTETGNSTTFYPTITQPYSETSVSGYSTTVPSTSNLMFIIIGASAGGGFLLIVLIVVAVCLVIRKRRSKPLREHRPVDLGPTVAIPTSLEKPPSEASPTAETVYLEDDKQVASTEDPKSVYDEPDDDRVRLRPNKDAPKPTNRPTTFLEKMKEKGPQLNEENDKSLYEDGYMVTPAGQTVPESFQPVTQPRVEHGYVNYPSTNTPVNRLSVEDLADRRSFGNLGALITRLYASGENQATHEYENDRRRESEEVYMEAQ